MHVEQLMTTSVVTVDPGTSVHDAARLLAEGGFTLLPVVEDGHLVGVVGESDVLRGRVRHDARSSPRLMAENATAPPRTVGQVMTGAVQSVAPWCDVADATSLLADGDRRSLPVVRDGELVGIVTRRDIARVLGRSDDELQGMIDTRLRAYARGPRWDVHVRDGEVALCDEFDDPVEQHVVLVIAAAVPGVVHVRTGHRDRCPFQHAAR